MQIQAVALKDFVAADMHHHIQITGRRAVRAGLALAGKADGLLVFDTGRNVHIQRFAALHAACAMAFNAWLFDFAAGTAAGGTSLLQLENSLAYVHHAGAVAGGAGGGGGAGFGAGAVADVALFVRGNGDAFFAARRGFFQRYFNIVAQIFALKILLACPAAAEHLAENIAEIEAARTAETTEAAGIAVYAGLAELIVTAAFFAVGEDFVGLLDGFEFLFRFLIIGIAVGMVFHRQLAVGLFDFVIGGIAGDTEGLIIILIAHGC